MLNSPQISEYRICFLSQRSNINAFRSLFKMLFDFRIYLFVTLSIQSIQKRNFLFLFLFYFLLILINFLSITEKVFYDDALYCLPLIEFEFW